MISFYPPIHPTHTDTQTGTCCLLNCHVSRYKLPISSTHPQTHCTSQYTNKRTCTLTNTDAWLTLNCRTRANKTIDLRVDDVSYCLRAAATSNEPRRVP